MDIKQAYLVLGLVDPVNTDQVEESFRSLVTHAHPDRGGSNESMSELRSMGSE